MTIPAAPLPSLRDLLSVRRARPFAAKAWAAGCQGRVVRVFRRGGMALAAGVEVARRDAAASQATVWVPGYFCNEALDWIRRLPVILRFYQLREDGTPDWEALDKRIPHQPGPHVFVLVHYFGFPNALSQARAYCDQYGMVLFEDAAHVLLPGGGIGEAELVIFSPRKLLAIPSGGLLVLRKDWAGHLEPPSGDAPIGGSLCWLVRRSAQRLMLGLRIPWHRFRKAGRNAESPRPIHELPIETQQCDPLALRLLAIAGQDLSGVADRRRENYARLAEWAAPMVGARPAFPHLPEGVCPYAFPLLVHGGCEAVASRLQSRGVPASRWPDLPPEVLTAKEMHRVAVRMYERLLLLPVHQSLSLGQIDFVGRQLQLALATV